MRRIVGFLLTIPLFTACSGPLDISGEFLNAINDAARSRAAAEQQLKSVFNSPGAKSLPDYHAETMAGKLNLTTQEQKSAAAQLASAVAGAQEELDTVRIMYEQARGDWNGLIDTATFLIQTNHNISDWKDARAALQTARDDTKALGDRVIVALRRLDSAQQVILAASNTVGFKPTAAELSPEEKKALEATQSIITQYVPIVGPILNALLAAQLQQNADDRAHAVTLLASLKWLSSDCVLGEKTCAVHPKAERGRTAPRNFAETEIAAPDSP